MPVEFSSLLFLYLFLPLTAVVYFLMPGIRRKNIVLLVASLLFYSMGQPLYLPLLVGLSYVNYSLAKRIPQHGRRMLFLAVGIDLAVLCLFKYLDFFLGMFGVSTNGGLLLSAMQAAVRWLNGIFHMTLREPTGILPLGISFYTFQTIAYLVDVYRKKTEPQQSFLCLLLYLSMFPKMMQGPIVRYAQIEPQLTQRRTNPRMVFEGISRFTVGLAKKVLIADYAGKVVSGLASDVAGATVVGAWLGALMFMFQIYFDFSGYSDMAIGLGRVFGFRYPENFDIPYMSVSITDFWRRWHMTLGSFFRDYVYIPLGGNRKGKARQILNLLIVWALTGLWHGANWNYVLWGLYFFLLLSAEKQLLPKLEKLPAVLRTLITMFFVLIGWVIFSHESLAELGSTFAAMFGGAQFCSATVKVRLLNSLPLLLVCLIGASVLPRWFGFIFSGLLGMKRGKRRGWDKITAKKAIYVVCNFAFILVLLWLCTVSMIGSTSAPSIYANF